MASTAQCIILTMKFSLAFSVVLAVFGVFNINASPVRSSSELHDVLDEFLALIPKDRVKEIFREYAEKDPQVQAAIEYMKSDEFKKLVKKVESIDDVIEFYVYLNDSGLDIYRLVNKLHEFIGLPPLTHDEPSTINRMTGGLSGLLKDIEAILPIDDIKALYQDKLKTSPAFAELVEKLHSPKFQELIDALRANEEFRKIVKFCREAGIDIEAIKNLLKKVLGLEFPEKTYFRTSDLHDDLEDFLALLPIEEITKIAMDYLENDPEITETIEYLRSPALRKIVEEVGAMKEARDVLAYLQESGLDAYGFLNNIHELLGIPPFKPSYVAKMRVSRATGGLAGLIADIKAILPMNDIKALYHEKLENSPAFANLIKRLSSPEFQEFVDAVLAKEEARVIINKLKSHGIDLKSFADLLSTILGLKFPKPTIARANDDLVRDLDDFLDILPLEEIADIAVDYVLNDADVQKAAAYIKTDEFKILATDAQQNNEFRTFVNYLELSGLPAFEYINILNRYLTIPQVMLPKSLSASLRSGDGVRGMLDAIEAVLPRDKIKQMYEDKLNNSGAFIYFVEHLRAPEFQAIVDRLVRNEDFRKLGYRAAEFGIDLKAIVDFMSKIFGIKISDDLLS